MTNKVDDIEDMYEEEYKNYYKDILHQMEKQGFSKVQIAVQEMMYKEREDLFETFINRYEFADTIIEFTPEEQEE